MRNPTDELQELAQRGLLRTLHPTTRLPHHQHGRCLHNGQEILDFASNDYLGLANSPHLRQAAIQAIQQHGTSTRASRLISGSTPQTHELEHHLAQLMGTPQEHHALYFANGYTCSLGVLTSLLQKNDLVILDKLCHASLIDGARLSGATLRTYPHNNLDRLHHLLARLTPKLTRHQRLLIVTESLFSMDGDLAPLTQIVELAEQYGALLALDEAHAFGLRGPTGLGLAAELNLSERIDFRLITFGKAAGGAGGAVIARHPWINLMVNRARSLIYTTAPPPAQSTVAHTALKLLTGPTGHTQRQKLRQNIHTLATSLNQPPKQYPGGIVPWITGSNKRTLHLSQTLLQRGYLIPGIRYPTVPRGQARLRITLSAAHQTADIRQLAHHLQTLPAQSPKH